MKDKNTTDLAELFDKESKGGSRVIAITEGPEEAQQRANDGRIVVGIEPGHIVFVIPYNGRVEPWHTTEQGPSGGPLVAQAGHTNGIFTTYSAFKIEEKEVSEIKYYELIPDGPPRHPTAGELERVKKTFKEQQQKPAMIIVSAIAALRRITRGLA